MTVVAVVVVLCGRYTHGEDRAGFRYICPGNRYEVGCVDLSMLSPRFELRLAYHGGVPAEPNDRLMLVEGGNEREIRSLGGLAHAVCIDSPEQALEFLRFGSSYRTVHLFQDEMLEVYEGTCSNVCVEDEWWDGLGAVPATVQNQVSGWAVIRTVARPRAESIWLLDICIRFEALDREGESEGAWEVPIGVVDSDDIGLRFPFFM